MDRFGRGALQSHGADGKAPSFQLEKPNCQPVVAIMYSTDVFLQLRAKSYQSEQTHTVDGRNSPVGMDEVL